MAGAERGIEPAVAAADVAQRTGGYDEAATLVRMAIDLLSEGDERRPRLLGRLGIVLAWALAFDEAVTVAAEAGDALAEAEGKAAAAEYLSDAAYVCAMAGGITHAWDLARTGLTYAGARDVAWARLFSFDAERRAAEDPDFPGIPVDSAERREAARLLRDAHLDPFAPGPMEGVFDSRTEALESANFMVLTAWAGEIRRCLPLAEAEAHDAIAAGRVARAAHAQALVSVCHDVLGDLHDARRALAEAVALADRLGQPVGLVLQAQVQLALATDEGWDDLVATVAPLRAARPPALAWFHGWLSSVAARAAARRRDATEALACVDALLPWLERAPAWMVALPAIADAAVETLWLLERLDHAPEIERAIRDKVMVPDFRFCGTDGRLALARLCALSGRYDEAVSWFAQARAVCSEQGARPRLAVCDYDEARMYARRAGPGDADRARALLDAARAQYEAMGLTGRLRRTAELRASLG